MMLIGIVLVLVLLVGCTPSTPVLTPAPSPTAVVAATSTATPPPTHTPTAVSTASPSPMASSTPTTVPTTTPTARPTEAPPATPTPRPAVTAGQEVALLPAARQMLSEWGDLPGYEIEAAIDMETLAISGHERIVYTHRQEKPLDAIYMHLYPNSPRFGSEMTVSNVAVDGQPATVSQERGQRVLRIVLPGPLSAGARTTIELDFRLSVPRVAENRFQVLLFSKGILSLGGWYPSLAVLDEGGWHLDYPEVDEIGDMLLGESAFYTVQVRAPQALVIAATGVQVQEESFADGTRTLTYRSGPSRTFYLSASPDYQVIDGQAGEITVHSYHLPGHETCAQWALESAVAALDLYQDLYGAYPFAEFDVVEGDRWYEGMEWPGLMLHPSVFYGGDDPACGEWFVAHEVAHQWWYNVVGNDPVAHPWLDEAFAQYSAMLYFRRLWPASAAEAYIQPIVYDRYAIYAAQTEEVRVGQPVSAFPDREAYYAMVYARGAIFLEAVHEKLGDDAFFAALQEYYRQNQFRIATPDKLKAALQAAGSDQVETLWAEWIVAP